MRFSVATSLLTVMMASRKAEASSFAMCRVNPDPHYVTFDSIYYDYHGSCDTVLIKNPTFDGSDDFYLHLRTTSFNAWGGIERAALKIGADELEVLDDGTYIFSGGPITPASTMGQSHYKLTHAPGSATMPAAWEVELDNDQYVRITNFNYGTSTSGSISVEVYASASHFQDSVGMCGTWQQPGLIARDGTTDYQGNPNAGNQMGLNWEVLAAEPYLFSFPNSPPGVCNPGPLGHGTGQGGDGADGAEKECEDVEGQDFNNCVFDVTVTGNVNWANAPLYHNYECATRANMCKIEGGKCIELKDCDHDTHHCNRRLCRARNIPDWLLALDGKEKGPLSDFRDPCVCAIPKKFASGKCCHYKGPEPHNCAGIENLGPDADLDGRCNAVNQGNSCEWNYDDPECCEISVNDANCNLPDDEAIEACECALKKEQGIHALHTASSLRAGQAGGA